MGDIHKDLASLIGSRICHDLISPIGAIGNGVELLNMSQTNLSPEMALISESVQSANARIRFFRIAFGNANFGQSVNRGEVRSILDDIGVGGRHKVNWILESDPPRPLVKLVFLLIQCLETAMPYGGEINITQLGQNWVITTNAKRMNIDPSMWEMLINGNTNRDISPAEVHFALVRDTAEHAGRVLQTRLQDTAITLTF